MRTSEVSTSVENMLQSMRFFFILAFFIQNFNNSTCKAKILGKISFWFSDSLLLARPNKLMSHFISVGVTKKGCFFQKLVLI
jgi:hypothetical protein